MNIFFIFKKRLNSFCQKLLGTAKWQKSIETGVNSAFVGAYFPLQI